MKCQYCSNDAKHTLVNFYHDYGCPVSWYPVCDDHAEDYKPRNDYDRGCKTLYGTVITETQRTGSSLGISLWHCDLCHEDYFTSELIETDKAHEDWHCTLNLCKSCAHDNPQYFDHED